ncbi:hypothetical protein [Roseivirga sp.]|uniref:hypothetical protein n=1 Tax=Roseivirga sp. TaxID=1964215 RepID=UPI003B8AE565
MTVCAIIVVFECHEISLERIIQQLNVIGLQQIIIVNNGISELSLACQPIVRLIEPNENLGAVGGFKLGMQKALESNCDNFWLLDEDNLPEENALSTICSDWDQLKQHTPENKLMMLSYRPHLFKYLHLSRTEKALNIGPLKNSYLGFHYRQFFQFLHRRLTKSQGNIHPDKQGLVKMNMGYFGGLFLHRSVIADGFLPDELFTIYWGDLHFTKHFRHAGGSIYMSYNSVINDIENELNQQKHFLHHPVLDLVPAFKAFDYVTGLLRFENEIQRSTIPYSINKVIMLSLLRLMAILRGKSSRIKLLSKARAVINK